LRKIKLQNGKCTVCRKTFGQSYHIDHIVPLSKGGDNTNLNIQILCPPCNLSKKDKDPVSYMQSMGFLI
jgi:5-methylcytosine-specific restriction endonuclease McrA